MTLAVTAVACQGIEVEEAVNKRYRQKMILSITGANTDFTWDLGTYAGTFWTATSGSTPGAAALLAIKDIQTRAKSFRGIGATGLQPRVQADASQSSVVVIAGTVGGGAATGTATVTGLVAATDTILAVTQDVKGANSLPLLGYNTPANNALGYVYSADPGANGTIKVTVLRTGVTTVQAGTYQLAMDATNTQLPNLLFVTGDAPTACDLILEWDLKAGEEPVELVA